MSTNVSILGNRYIENGTDNYFKISEKNIIKYSSSEEYYLDMAMSLDYEKKIKNLDFELPMNKSKLLQLIPLCDNITLRSNLFHNECYQVLADLNFTSKSMTALNVVIHSKIEKKNIPVKCNCDITSLNRSELEKLLKGKSVENDGIIYNMSRSVSSYSLNSKIKENELSKSNESSMSI